MSRFEYRRDDYWLDVVVKPVTWQADRVTSVAVVARDVSDYKRNEFVLEESYGRSYALFDDSPISLWEADFSAVKTHLKQLQAEGVLASLAIISTGTRTRQPAVLACCG